MRRSGGWRFWQVRVVARTGIAGYFQDEGRPQNGPRPGYASLIAAATVVAIVVVVGRVLDLRREPVPEGQAGCLARQVLCNPRRIAEGKIDAHQDPPARVQFEGRSSEPGSQAPRGGCRRIPAPPPRYHRQHEQTAHQIASLLFPLGTGLRPRRPVDDDVGVEERHCGLRRDFCQPQRDSGAAVRHPWPRCLPDTRERPMRTTPRPERVRARHTRSPPAFIVFAERSGRRRPRFRSPSFT